MTPPHGGGSAGHTGTGWGRRAHGGTSAQAGAGLVTRRAGSDERRRPRGGTVRFRRTARRGSLRSPARPGAPRGRASAGSVGSLLPAHRPVPGTGDVCCRACRPPRTFQREGGATPLEERRPESNAPGAAAGAPARAPPPVVRGGRAPWGSRVTGSRRGTRMRIPLRQRAHGRGPPEEPGAPVLRCAAPPAGGGGYRVMGPPAWISFLSITAICSASWACCSSATGSCPAGAPRRR